MPAPRRPLPARIPLRPSLPRAGRSPEQCSAEHCSASPYSPDLHAADLLQLPDRLQHRAQRSEGAQGRGADCGRRGGAVTPKQLQRVDWIWCLVSGLYYSRWADLNEKSDGAVAGQQAAQVVPLQPDTGQTSVMWCTAVHCLTWSHWPGSAPARPGWPSSC